jgi:hypothetical protein
MTREGRLVERENIPTINARCALIPSAGSEQLWGTRVLSRLELAGDVDGWGFVGGGLLGWRVEFEPFSLLGGELGG